MDHINIKKIIIPVAGYGTRFLPATKAQPKEMLTIVDKPVIQYIVEEAVMSGIKDVILVTSWNKRAVEDHFDRNFELETRLKSAGKVKELKEIVEISDLAQFFYVRQKIPLGDGDAILQAKDLINDEPFAVAFGDDIVDSPVPCLKQLTQVFKKFKAPVIAVSELDQGEIKKFGIVGVEKVDSRTYKVTDLVEKPEPKKAPSNLGITGKYILMPEIMDMLLRVKKKGKGEIRLIDAFQLWIEKYPLYAYVYKGKRYDCGSREGLLEATIDFALKRKELRGIIKKKIKLLKINA